MKVIKYQYLSAVINDGAEEVIIGKTFPYSAENEEIAKREAYNGEYTIEDDGQPEPVAEPTAEEMLNALLGVTE